MSVCVCVLQGNKLFDGEESGSSKKMFEAATVDKLRHNVLLVLVIFP